MRDIDAPKATDLSNLRKGSDCLTFNVDIFRRHVAIRQARVGDLYVFSRIVAVRILNLVLPSLRVCWPPQRSVPHKGDNICLAVLMWIQPLDEVLSDVENERMVRQLAIERHCLTKTSVKSLLFTVSRRSLTCAMTGRW